MLISGRSSRTQSPEIITLQNMHLSIRYRCYYQYFSGLTAQAAFKNTQIIYDIVPAKPYQTRILNITPLFLIDIMKHFS